MWLGGLLAGRLTEAFTTETAGGTKVVDWQGFWLVPSVGVFASLLVFVLLFRMKSRSLPDVAGPAPRPGTDQEAIQAPGALMPGEPLPPTP
jgi:hypothetical protein